jgi:hypothetical protein
VPAIASTLCLTIPKYVPSGVPAAPIASLNSSPPITSVCPRDAAPSISASIVFRGTLLSTNTAGTFLATKAQETSFFARFKGVAGKRKLPYADSAEAMDLLRGKVPSGDVD